MMSDNKRLRKPERQFYTPKQRHPLDIDMDCSRPNTTGPKGHRGASEPKDVGSFGRNYNNYNERGGGGVGGGGGGGYEPSNNTPHFMKHRHNKYGPNQQHMPYNNTNKTNDMPYNDSTGGESKGPEKLRLPSNIEQLAPRFKKKYLEESGLPLSYLENIDKTGYMDDSGKDKQHGGGQFKKPGGPHNKGPQKYHNRNNHPHHNKGMKESYNNHHNNTNTFDMRRPRSRSSDVNLDDNRDIDEISQSSGYFHGPRHIYNSQTNVYSSNNSLHSNDSNWQNDGYRNDGYWEKSKKNRENRHNNHYKMSVNNRLRLYSSTNSGFDHSDHPAGGPVGPPITNLNKQLENIAISDKNKPYDENSINDWNQEVENSKMLKNNEHMFNSQENIHHKNGQMTLPFDRNRRGKYNNHNRRRSFTTDNFNQKEFYNANNPELREVVSPKPWVNHQNYQNDQHATYDRPPIHNHNRNMQKPSSRDSSLDRYEYRPNSRNGGDRRRNKNGGKYYRNYNNPNQMDSAPDKSNQNESSWRTPRSYNNDNNQEKMTDPQIDNEIQIAREIKEQVNALTQKILFDPTNPHKPIIVNSHPNRNSNETKVEEPEPVILIKPNSNVSNNMYQLASLDYIIVNPPIWYDANTREYQSVHKRELVEELKKYDFHIQTLIGKRTLFKDWDEYLSYRAELQTLLQQFLMHELKFCQQENVETHFWKLLYHSIIDLMRKWLSDETDGANKYLYNSKLFELIDNGAAYFEQLLCLLEQYYNFSLNEFMGQNTSSIKSLKNVGLALVSAQKILIFLGDLARYKEQINNSSNYGRAKQWYMKAQSILPKNGRPYNSLAILSLCTKRKPDAVYFYMRSIMSSNSFQSARESLVSLFDEIRRKYESTQKKREESQIRTTKPKNQQQGLSGALRRETWIHPQSGLRIYRTSSLDPQVYAQETKISNFENELKGLDPIELNKRFILSFLHVQGKLMTKVGMESFVSCAKQMLGEFRALLGHTPIAITSTRFLQLIALNMFSIDCNLPKVKGEKSEAHEQALSVALSMFGIILERFNEVIVKLLQSQTGSNKIRIILPEDGTVMLPAIKVWCDWMRNHQDIWNPPLENVDLKSGYLLECDPWEQLATAAGHLERIDIDCSKLSSDRRPEYELLQLPENITLAGFTPLSFYESEEHVFYYHSEDVDVVQNSVRLYKLYEFCSKFVCTCDPPVLKIVHSDNNKPNHYVSIIQNNKTNNSDILLETTDDLQNETNISIQGDYVDNYSVTVVSDELISNLGADNQNILINNVSNDMLSNSCENDSETRILLQKKDELERQHKLQEMDKQRLQKILRESTISLHIEVRPKFLIPDTNCFVDCLSSIETIAQAYPTYQLMVPLVVVNELEGLSRGGRNVSKTKSFGQQSGQAIDLLSHSPTHKNAADESEIQHAIKVASISKEALIFLKSKNTTIKCVTSRGSILSTATFTVEDDSTEPMSNDDKILATALNLCKTENDKLSDTGEVRQVFRKVVLLTTDRNLRVKALSRDVPVREMSDFIKWAGLEKSSP